MNIFINKYPLPEVMVNMLHGTVYCTTVYVNGVRKEDGFGYTPTNIVDEDQDIKAFEKGLRDNDPHISPSQIYTYAAIMERVPYVNGSPNVSVEIPALQQLAMEIGSPIAGSDFKTGQTLMKTIIAPGLKNRLLGVDGWFSTNILGNRDGEVLDDPGSFRSKEITKCGVLEDILNKGYYQERESPYARS